MKSMYQHIMGYCTKNTGRNLFIVTANPEIVQYASETPQYAEVIQQADYVVPDGIGIVHAARLLKTPLQARVPGIELMELCFGIAEKERKKVFLLGAKEEVLNKAIHRIQSRYPNIIIKGHHGYINQDDVSIAEEICAFNPDFLFVGMGYPKQEEWIQMYRKCFTHTVMMGVGGSIDVWSGEVKRAPLIWQKLNLEWLYRSIKDIKRIKRLQRLPKFVWAVLKQKYTNVGE
ncbi:WecB/TagA/CpsF family glycosyltransferase [Staphylococcus sp. 17KM0847]|nr:WecB/TagA/CpsF family glycosyltransferase [Staphylococcus sp. 17KM0847]